MNRVIVAWMDDFQMSSQLAKLSTSHSYTLQFINKIEDLHYASVPSILIIDLGNITEKELKKLNSFKAVNEITLLGFCQEINSSVLSYFKEMGFDYVFNYRDLIKNIESVINKIFYAI